MKKLILLLTIVLFFTILPVLDKASASVCDLSAIRSEYSARGLSGSGLEQEAIDDCLAEQRRLDQQARDQVAADAEINTLNSSSYGIGGIAVQFQMAQNSSKAQRLKSQYGISAYYNCYPCTYKDTSFPSVEASCLIQTEYCLERQVMQKKTTCSSGFVYFNGRCVTLDQGCKENIGQGGYYTGKIDTAGKYICACGSGYQWNSQGTSCIIAPIVPIKTNDQICQDSYGVNSSWNGTKNNKGDLICDCKTGYEWNSNKTACIKKEVTISPKIKGVDHLLFPEGALIRAINGIDIYIVKYVGTKKFKRLILSPSVFNNYGHLRWEDVMDVSQSTLNSFTTSELVRAVGDNKIYRLYPQGDSGQKRLVKNNSVLTRLGLDPDSIYEINSFDRESYIKGLDLE